MNTRGSHGDDDSDDDDNEFALNTPPQSPAAGPPKKYQLAPPITPRTPRRGSNGNGSGLNTSSAHASRNNVPKTPNKATKTNNSSGSSNKTPTSSPIKKRHSITSGSSSSNNHHHSHRSSTTEKPASGKDVQVLTEMVQTLAQKLKKRDVQVQELSATSVKYAEVCLQLEHAEERLVTLSAEKSSLQRQVHSLQTQNQKQTFQDAVVGDTIKEGMSLTTSPITTPVPPATVDMEEFRSIRSQRDTAMFKAGELSIALAESRAEQDELRDHLTAVTDSLSQQQNYKS